MYGQQTKQVKSQAEQQRTTVPRRATLAPALRTRAKTTLPKLPSPISLSTSNLSSSAIPLMTWVDPRRVKSCATVMLPKRKSLYLKLRRVARRNRGDRSKVQVTGESPYALRRDGLLQRSKLPRRRESHKLLPGHPRATTRWWAKAKVSREQQAMGVGEVSVVLTQVAQIGGPSSGSAASDQSVVEKMQRAKIVGEMDLKEWTSVASEKSDMNSEMIARTKKGG